MKNRGLVVKSLYQTIHKMSNTRLLLVRAVMTLLLSVSASFGFAQSEAEIQVWLTDDSCVPVLFSAMPDITLEDGNLTFKGKDVDLAWPIEQVKRLTLAELDGPSTDIKTLRKTSLDLLSDHFDAYDISGRLIRQCMNSLSELPRGTYIVKDGKVSIKVIRR